MKLKEIDENIGERETLIEPQYRKIDKHGRLYIGIDHANQEVLVVLVKPVPEDKIKWLRV